MKTAAIVRMCTAIAVVIVVSTTNTPAQISFKLGAGGGLVMPQGNYGGSTAEYHAGSKYGLSTGWNAHAKIRLGLLGFNLAGQIGYTSVSNSGNPSQGGGTVEVSHNIFSIKVGPEYHISLPASPIGIYVGINGQMNSFGGSTSFQGVSGLPSKTFDLSSASRFGFGFSGGVILSTPVLPTLDIAVHYDLMNLTGRAFEQDTKVDNREESYSFLNDEKDPAYLPGDSKHFIGAPRAIQSLSLTVSVMFGL